MFVFKIMSCGCIGISCRIYMFPLFIEKDFKSKGGRKRKKKEKEGRKKEEENRRNRR